MVVTCLISNGRRRFCEVWRATDTVPTRPVAVKLLHAGYAHQPEARARFKAGARHAGALSHQNIARVYDYGEPPCGQSCHRCAVISDCVVFSPGHDWPGQTSPGTRMDQGDPGRHASRGVCEHDQVSAGDERWLTCPGDLARSGNGNTNTSRTAPSSAARAPTGPRRSRRVGEQGTRPVRRGQDGEPHVKAGHVLVPARRAALAQRLWRPDLRAALF